MVMMPSADFDVHGTGKLAAPLPLVKERPHATPCAEASRLHVDDAIVELGGLTARPVPAWGEERLT